MLMCEMNRLSSHLLFMATNGMDLGAVVDDDLRLAGARGAAAVPRDGHRPADEPQLHPPRRGGRRPARRLARATLDAPARHAAGPARGVRHPDDRPADLAGAAAGRRRHHRRGGHRARGHRPDPALHRLRLGPAPRHAVPRATTQVDFDVVVGSLRRLLRPLRDPAGRDPRVDSHRPPDPRQDAHRRLPHPGQEGHPAATGPHRRVDGSAHPPLQDLHRGLQGARGRGLRGGRVTPG